MAVSLDRKPLINSRKFILIADARAENSGQTYNATRTALKNPGQPPILMQGVEGVISIAVDPSLVYEVEPLDESGKMGKPLKTTLEQGELKFLISPKDHTSYYQVQTNSETSQ